MSVRLKLGMVGGGEGAFIGGVHRIAARIDGQWDLVAGALSSDPARAHASAAALGIAPDRSYDSFAQMAAAESARDDGIDAVAIVTPNHMHVPAALAFLRAGIHVICDKPLASRLNDALELEQALAQSGKLFVLTHNYSGYPLIRQARDMVARGELGRLRLVHVEYVQDWLTEAATGKQAEWRTDPARSGAGGAIGDIGTHAWQLAEFVTGQSPDALAADLSSFVDGRAVDDNAHVMLRYASGAKGMLWASQVAVGNENGLRLRIHGDKGGLDWAQENPNQMAFTRFGQPTQILTRGGAGANDAGLATTRIPAGHPEGYLEGFATLYREAADAIRAHDAGSALEGGVLPGLADGLSGMRFIDACLRSSKADGAWTPVVPQA
ncbi:Gfo/Idh/MocA family protein [Roseinatronobacter sp. S2]|uniref:Gfo/Idh/MocA family protein n=1 Tax=Roseinatronobacter sp. S2 TaxID=3035471 RepID=UPI00240FF4C9|nr:Gfo/Idh/MocA family oxidoreductase [Roseinatronobacter sp. S2]WFE76849.1 Gfo/Idh/MocA family oxidoreductase [Roseinatronobacter sp. S2]